MTEGSRRFVGSVPTHYDRGPGPVMFEDYAELTARRAASFAPLRVLETAVGTGFATRRLLDHLPAAARLVATDLDPPMLEIARGECRGDERVTFQAADATALPFDDGAFDAVVCQFGVMFYPDKDKSYREAYRVLAPGGRYLLSVWDGRELNGFGRVLSRVLAESFAIDPAPFLGVPFGYHAIDPIKESLLAAGFSGIRIDVVRIEAPARDVRAFAEAMALGSPLAERVAARGLERERLVDQVAAAVRREFGAPGRTMLQAVIFEASRD